MDKQAYGVYKFVYHLRPYLLNSKTKVIIPYVAIRNVLIQNKLGDKIAHWITMLQEYDFKINYANMLKGKRLCLLASQSNILENEQQYIYEEDMYADTNDVISALSS